MKKPSKGFKWTLRILGILAFIVYVLFLIDEKEPLFNNASFQNISVYLLFIFFLAGFLTLWLNELVSGILLIAWCGLEWCLGLWVWEDAAMVLILGFPVLIIGILVLIYGLIKKASSS
jgi:hypothetical protein